MIAYILDPGLAKTASGFVSQLLLSINTSFRLNHPQVNVLSKSDLISDEELDTIKKWSEDIDVLEGAILNEEASVYREMSRGILNLLREFSGQIQMIHSGKENFLGIDDLYTLIQLQFQGGEDLTSD